MRTHEHLLRQAGLFADRAVDDYAPDQETAQAHGELIAGILKDLS